MSAGYNIWLYREELKETCSPGIVTDLGTDLLQLFRGLPVILKTVQDDADTGIIQCSDFIVYINHPSVIRRVGDVKTYNM